MIDNILIGWTVVDGRWVPPPPTPAQVDTERDRRIAVFLTAATGREHTVESALRAVADGAREAARLLRVWQLHQDDPGEHPAWTLEQEARAAQLEQLDAQIEAIEAAAAVLRATEPIPADFADDKWWP